MFDIHDAFSRALPDDESTVDLKSLFFNFTTDVTTNFLFGQSVLKYFKSRLTS